MNRQIKSVATIAALMVLSLMIGTTFVQFVRAPDLNASALNRRSLIRDYSKDRGPIVVAGKAVASSKPVNDDYKYLRTYADGELYAPVTGFYSSIYGRTGIEQSENQELTGEAPSLLMQRIQDLFTGAQPQGGTVELTLNPDAQRAAMTGLGSQRGGVVALNPKTGAILALASTPSYDPNSLATHNSKKATAAYNKLIEDESRPLDNRAIASTRYPPGSTFKLVTASAALESGSYNEDTELKAPKQLPLPGTDVKLTNQRDSSCSASGKMTMKDALRISCNTAFAQLGMDLGGDALKNQAEKYGFNDSFSMPLPVTPSHFPDELNQPQTAMAAIGQYDVQATPMQMAMVTAAIANDGTLMKPYLVQDVRDTDLKVVQESKPSVYRNPISPGTAKQLTDMMVGVVAGGTGGAAQISGVQVAGKTGTAETDPDGGKPPDVWFVAFAPADDPQVAVAVAVEDGGSLGNSGTGGAIAGPIARSVMKAVLGR